MFPPVCPLCHILTAQEHQLCPTCQNALPPPPDHYCLRCGSYTAKMEPGCAHCLTNPMTSDAAYFAFRYQDSAISLIVGFKFADRSERSVLLGALCWERLGSELTWEAPDMIIPMPLHFWRLLRRRYNQSALLAGELAWRLQRPMVTNALVRCKITTPQTRLNAQARMKNVRGAFRAVEKRVRGRSIMLVDDVMTTGATMGVAVAALKKAGAARVVVVCLARVDQERTDSISMDKGVPYA
ncbi:MAG: ComF family protein [Magnetococcus sp. YQC-5]